MASNSANKRLAKNTLFLYFRSIFLLLITLYTSRVTLQVLGVEDYGVYQVVGGVVAMFSMLSTTLASASQRFITFALGEKNEENLKKVFSTCLTLHIALGAIVVVLLEVIGIWFLNTKMNIPTERLATASYVMQFSIATFFVGVISVPYNAVIIAHEKMSAFAYISIIEGLLKLGVVLLLSFISWDKLLLYGALHFGIAVLLRAIYSIYSTKHFEETRNLSLSIDKPQFKEMFAFAGWNLFGNGSLVLRNQGIDILLNIFFGVVVNAAKGVSNQVQHAVHTLVGNFTTAMKPQMTKAIAQKDYKRAFDLINYGSRYTFMMMLILAVPIIVVTPQLLSFWLVKVPDYSIEFVRWTMVYLLIDCLSRMLIHSILSIGTIRNYQIIVGGTKLLAIPLAYIYLLFSENPLIGVWVNILLEIVCLLERLYYNKKQLGFNWRSFMCNVIARSFGLFAISLITSFLVIGWLESNFILSALISVLLTFLIIWLIGLNKGEKKRLFNFLQNIIHKK